MKETEIYSNLNRIFKDVLDNDEIEVRADTTAEDIDEWDSLSHIQLVVAIEKAFGMKFTSIEVMNWKNVGEMVNLILIKTN